MTSREWLFEDRRDAGRRLADRLAGRLAHLGPAAPVVAGLPRGGVPVAAEVARALGAPVDVVVVRKLGAPYQPELAMGAVGEEGVAVLNPDVMRLAGVSDADLEQIQSRERDLVANRARLYRAGRLRVPLVDRVVVLVDDGIATGSTARAACRVARAEGAGRVVMAVPVAPVGWEDRLGGDADELVAVATPEPFYAVGRFYRDFSPVTDEEVVAALASTG